MSSRSYIFGSSSLNHKGLSYSYCKILHTDYTDKVTEVMFIDSKGNKYFQALKSAIDVLSCLFHQQLVQLLYKVRYGKYWFSKKKNISTSKSKVRKTVLKEIKLYFH